jgi:hypothetical protein
VADGLVVGSVDMLFELVYRSNGTDTTLASVTDHYDAAADTSVAQQHSYDLPAPAITFIDGDQFVFRYTGSNATSKVYYPNGDGQLSGGSIPNITLPQ